MRSSTATCIHCKRRFTDWEVTAPCECGAAHPDRDRVLESLIIPWYWRLFGWLTAIGAGLVLVGFVIAVALGRAHWGFLFPSSVLYFGVAGFWGWLLHREECGS